MARCAAEPCTTWRPGLLTNRSGVTVDDDWFCSQACVERMVQRRLSESTPVPAAPPSQSASHLRLGALLRHHGTLSADQLHQALEQQRTSGLRLGAQARALFGIDAALVLKALAAQAGTRYLTAIDPATVHDAPGGLPREAIEALGLIPFSHPDRQGMVRVASRAPIRWDGVAALRQLASWTPEPYLVEDDTWQQLLENYGAAPRPAGAAAPSRAVLVRTPQEAVARIATMAASARRARLSEANWDSHIWIRVQGEATVQDVLVSQARSGEGTWQAASTSR